MENIHNNGKVRRSMLHKIAHMSHEQFLFEVGIKENVELAKMISIVDYLCNLNKFIINDNRKDALDTFMDITMNNEKLTDIATIKAFELACVFPNDTLFAEIENLALTNSSNPDEYIANVLRTDVDHVLCYKTYQEIKKTIEQVRKNNAKNI